MGQYSEDTSLLKQTTTGFAFVLFVDQTHPECNSTRTLFMRLSTRYEHLFLCLDIAEMPSLVENWAINTVPTLIAIQNGYHKTLCLSTDPLQFRAALEKEHVLQTRIQALIGSDVFVVFMKGTLQNPRCKYTRRLLALLEKTDIIFSSNDILADEDLRQTLKHHSTYETYPQIYYRGVFFCGVDGFEEMVNADTLKKHMAEIDTRLDRGCVVKQHTPLS
eukprot:GHVN01042987.1.p1 GENE.GHVN01042987.1~~GHVN01042987.1.p1  ORF type:complete len:219 (+),score=14.68 GHVN01042987.1:2-658(+)